MFKYLFFTFILFVSTALAEDYARITRDISDTTMSPFCPGRTISACPSPEARKLRNKITAWLEQGYSEQAVRNQLNMIYGKEVAGKPDLYGFGLLAWIIPAVFIVFGLVLIVKKIDKPSQIYTDTLDEKIQLELEQRLRN